MTFAVRWIHNDGTFSSDHSVTLPLDAPVAFTVGIAAKTAGAHSAILSLIDPRTKTAADERMNTVVAAEQFTAGNAYAVVRSGSVGHPGVDHVFVNVPAGTSALEVGLDVDAAQLPTVQSKLLTGDLLAVFNPNAQRGTPGYRGHGRDGTHWQQAFARPQPGVWEIAINNVSPDGFSANPARHTPLPPLPYRLTARVYAVTAKRTTAAGGIVSYQLTNRFAPIHLRAGDTPSAKTRAMTVSLAPGRSRKEIAIDVPEGATEVRASIAAAANPNVDVYLFDCTTKVPHGIFASTELAHRCDLKATGNAATGGVAVDADGTIAPGRWIAVVDARRATAPESVAYADLITAPAYGTTHVHVSMPALGTGARTTMTVSATDPTFAPAPRLTANESATIWAKGDEEMLIDMVHARVVPIFEYATVWEGTP